MGKKEARKQQEELNRQNMAYGKEDRAFRTTNMARADTQQAKAEPFVAGLESTAPGQLSPLAENQLAADQENIARTYDAIREQGLRALGSRGFGRAPSGFTSSMINSAGENQGRAETDAYRRAQDNTYQQGLQALNYRTGQQGVFMGQGNQDISNSNQENEQASLGIQRRMEMGSTLGDIMGGISTVGGLIAAPFTGGASLGLSSLFSRGKKKDPVDPMSTWG